MPLRLANYRNLHATIGPSWYTVFWPLEPVIVRWTAPEYTAIMPAFDYRFRHANTPFPIGCVHYVVNTVFGAFLRLPSLGLTSRPARPIEPRGRSRIGSGPLNIDLGQLALAPKLYFTRPRADRAVILAFK